MATAHHILPNPLPQVLPTKACSQCHQNKPLSEFSRDKKSADGHCPECKTCAQLRWQRWRDGKDDHRRQRSREYREKHKDVIAKRDKLYKAHVKLDPGKAEAIRERDREYMQRYRANPARQAQARARRQKDRQAVIEHYSRGKNACQCCGETTYEFLSLDHIEGGGRAHRSKVGDVYRWLIRNEYPAGYRILCHNCNLALGLYGYCPHQPKQD